MDVSVEDDRLAKKRCVFVVVRLLLEEDNRLVYGEVVDESGKCHSRFRNWSTLSTIMQMLVDGFGVG